MNCPAEENIVRLIDGELSLREEEAMAAHLESCPACRALYEEIYAAANALKDHHSTTIAPRRRKSSRCPDDETLIAYADGSIVGEKERKGIASHLARCDVCARKVARAMETVRLLKRIVEEGPRKVPPELAKRVRDHLSSPRTRPLGQFIFKLEELRENLGRGFEYLRRTTLPAPVVAEGAAVFKVGEKKRPQKASRREMSLSAPDFLIILKVKPMAAGKADLSVGLSDKRSRPLERVGLKLEKEGKEFQSRTTGKKGGASFRGLKPGEYRLFIRFREESYLDLSII